MCFAFLWVPAPAGMTEGWRTLGPPLNEGEGDCSREKGFNCDVKDGSGVLCFSLGSPACEGDGGLGE